MRAIVFSIEGDTPLKNQLSALSCTQPDFIIAFLPPNDLLQTQLDTITIQWSGSMLVGATAVQQFTNSNLHNNGTLHLFWFNNPNHCAWIEVIESDAQSNIQTDHAISTLRTKKPDATLLLVDGIRFPVYQLLDKLRKHCPNETANIAGGLASKNIDPEQYFDNNGGWTFVGNRIYNNAAVLIGFKGIDINVLIIRGWEPASPIYTVTHAKNNILFSIDNIPATKWYREFFTLDGEMPPLPDASYGFPLIIDGPDPARKHIYRTMVAFDNPTGSVTFAGDIQTGDRIRLGIGNGNSLVKAAEHLNLKNADTCLLFSCVARELVLGDSTKTELETLHKKSPNTPLSGFFTLGEIGPSNAGQLGFYNQTGVLAQLTEQRE